MDALAAAYDRASTAEQALEDAQAEVERLEALAPEDVSSKMESAQFPNKDGAFAIKFANSWATAFMARTFFSVLKGIGAKNYVEVGYTLEGKPLIVTIMHPDGDRPSVIVDRLTRENEALKRALALEVAEHAVTKADLKCWIAAEAFAQGAWDKDNPDHDDVRLDAELASAKAALAAMVNP